MMQSASARRIRQGLAEPHRVVRQVNRWYYRLTGDDDRGVDFFEEDWDNILLLDACRYDTFADQADLPGELESRYSRASATREFLYEYFDGGTYHDTVYVTANPQLYRRRHEVDVSFHDVVNVWRDEGWDDDCKTVQPETMARTAEATAERYPDKRLFVHFMQPHYPFIGETGRKHLTLDHLDFGNGTIKDLDVDDEVLRRAYRENLDVVLPSVSRLLDVLDGQTVVTADHGELLGERAFPLPMREYGHPAGIRTEALNKVPWLVHRSGPRKQVVSEESTADDEGDGEDDEVVEQRLRELGYR